MFQIIIKGTKEFLRDKTSLFFYIIFPTSLIFLLGNLLMSMDNAEEPIGAINLHYSIESEVADNERIIEGFIKEMNESESISFQITKDSEHSRQMAGKDEITAYILFQGNPLNIVIYEGSNVVQNRTVNAIINGFATTNHAISAIIDTAPESIKEVDPDGEWVEHKALGVNRSMLDYYAVAMIAMNCMMSIIVGANAFVAERQSRTINRLIICPKRKVPMFLQIILSLLPQAIIQNIVVMVVSEFVFKAHYSVLWMDNLYLFGMFLIITVATLSVGAVIGLIIKAHPIAVIMPFIWIILFLGGTYSKEIYIKGLTELMPSNIMQQAAFEVTLFGRFDKGNQIIIVCMLMIAVMLTIGAFIFSKKQEER